MTPLDWLLEPLTFDFMTRALLVTAVAGVTCALLSCWLVQIGWALMGDAVSHAVLPGVAVSYILGWPFAVGAFIFGVGAVALIGGVRSTTRIKSDAAIGVVFTSLFALGLVIISVTPSQTDLGHILFGNVLGVSDSDILQVVVIGALTCAVLLAKRRDFTLLAFDRSHAGAIGINTRVLSALLLGLLALTVVVALQAVGIILVVAMLITPGATASLLTKRFERMLALAVLVTVAASVVGVYASFYLDVSTGGAVVLAQAAAFLLAYLFGGRGGVVTAALRRRRAVTA
ncbi:metal ABC transporter permease [Salinibacterium sp. SYSU T00001]|uniref:metal ABC transporter permease n=1 Tax=Homoserinimonas sedimenticola TaxID=2986805 RepID=UPI002236B1DF|nr:metal ABC transporter permease [Salinibacterium sedimenticola]MCW4386578.1 metal ABC transporter permease [Salinibacterium sedimenticola]